MTALKRRIIAPRIAWPRRSFVAFDHPLEYVLFPINSQSDSNLESTVDEEKSRYQCWSMFRVIILLIIPLFIRPCFQRTFYYMLLQDLLQLFGIKVVLKDMHSTNALGRKTTPCIQFLWMRYLWSDVFRIKCFTDWPLYMYSSRATVQLDDSFVREQDTLPVWLGSIYTMEKMIQKCEWSGKSLFKIFRFRHSSTHEIYQGGVKQVWRVTEEWMIHLLTRVSCGVC